MEAEHNHHACIDEALSRADRICARRGVRLTPLRRQVLEEIWQSHEAVKAYDLIRQLSSTDHAVKPPTVYRALDFLLEQGLIHRIESLNGYVGCNRPHKTHQSQLFICRLCGQVSECGDEGVSRALDREAARQGFLPEERIVEVRGLCSRCQAQPTPP
jgi:Fur family transcriptional regulator, zinc uptake regulator